jgi:hypothetical protein
VRTLPVPAGCRCLEIEGLEGDAALDHAAHLRLDRSSTDGWTAEWTCEATGATWLETHLVAWRSSDPATRLDRTSVPVPTVAGALARPDRRTGLSAGRLTALAIALLVVAAVAAIGVP